MENEDNFASRKDSDVATPAQTRNKKLYTKPAFKCERVFEVQALACSKQSANSMCPITLHKPDSRVSVERHVDFALSKPQQGVQGSWPDALVPRPRGGRVRNRAIRTNRNVDERFDGLSSGN